MSKISDELRTYAEWWSDSIYTKSLAKKLRALADRIDAEMVELPRGKDGKPIRVGETVYTANGKEFHVIGIDFDRLEHRIKALDDSHCTCIIAASLLAHERPDSLERIADEIDEMVDAAHSADDNCERLADLADRIRKLAKKEG